MNDAKDWQTIAKLKKERRFPSLVSSDDISIKKWHDIHTRLNEAQRAAEALAYARMDADMFAAIEMRQVEKALKDDAAVRGETLNSILSIRN